MSVRLWGAAVSAGVLTFMFAASVPPAAAQVTVTAVMKSGERHTGQNPRLDGIGEFALRRQAQPELRVKTTEIAYLEFAGAEEEAIELDSAGAAVVLRDGTLIAGELIDMGHVMHDDESSDFVVRFRDERGEDHRYSATQIARLYF